MRRPESIGLICVFVAATAWAADPTVRYDTDYTTDRTVVVEHDTGRDWVSYKANEVNFSFFGSGTVGEKTIRHLSTRGIQRNGRLGAGAGLSYFFCRYVGVEAYAYTENTDHNFVDNVGGDLIARLPIGNSGVAPYIFGGGGRQLDPLYQWTWDAGAGIEWRFVPHVGIFLDGRYVWADKTKDYGLGRVGLRVGF
jgi:hypothetical protein